MWEPVHVLASLGRGAILLGIRMELARRGVSVSYLPLLSERANFFGKEIPGVTL